MGLNSPSPPFRKAFAVSTVALMLGPAAWAGNTYRVLHGFGQGKDGGGVFGGLVEDKKSSVYGTTSGGGIYNLGTVFKLTPSGGLWTETILHSFDGNDGALPVSGLTLDPAGNLYGATSRGGTDNSATAFELTPGSGGWKFSVLYDAGSYGNLVLDKAGNLYGTGGPGAYDEGDVFELTPASDGWTRNVLYSFCPKPHCLDGAGPYAGPIWDTSGKLYGTTQSGGKGSPQWGTAFELKHKPDGTWQHILLHSFPSFPGDGEVVYAGLVFDTSGNLYGATNSGGGHLCSQTSTCGTVFKLSRNANGLWKETILYRFPNPYDGNSPGASLVFDKASGNLYGTAAGGGNNACSNGCGVVFKLAPASTGTWKYIVLHRFTGSDGANPAAALILDEKGNLYGTTTLGGAGGAGVVFEITP